MKFLFVTDTQIRGNNPEHRLGSYPDDLYLKMKEVVQIGREMHVDFFVHGGDVFDRPIISLGIADKFADLMESSGKEWFVIRGNHDEIGHDPNLSGETMLDHLFRRSKVIKHLGSEIFEDGSGYIEGFDYYHNIERDIKEKGLKASMPHIVGRRIAVVHAFIVPTPFLPSVMHIVCRDITSDFNLVLCGHYHGEFGVHRHGETTYVGIGAFARMSLSEADARRRPNVLFVDTKVPSMKVIPLESAKNGTDIFEIDKIVQERAMQGKVEDFISSLEGTKIQGLNLRGVIEELAKQKNIERAVIDEVIKRIGLFE